MPLTPFPLDSKVAVITGAAGGIGLGMARAAIAHGMRVTISDVDGARAAEAADALAAGGATVTSHACDVRDLAQVETLRDAAIDDHGRVDLVCNNAGVGLARPLPDCTDADWNLLFDVNVTGVVNGVRAFLPTFIAQGSGHISATASLSGLIGDPDLTVYNTSKFAVVGLLEATAQELRRDHPGVTASVLCPGPVATDLIASSAKQLADSGSGSSELDEAVGEYLARGLHPDDVGRIAIDGIAEGRFWLLPHAELTFELLDERLAAMKRGELAQPEDDWTDQS